MYFKCKNTSNLKIYCPKKVKDIAVCEQERKSRDHNRYTCVIPFIFSQINTEWNLKKVKPLKLNEIKIKLN
jgi:hypothetical protein